MDNDNNKKTIITGLRVDSYNSKYEQALRIKRDEDGVLSGAYFHNNKVTPLKVFINTNKEDGTPFISLNTMKEDQSWETIATGNAINSNKKGDPVDYKTIAFNFNAEHNEETIFAKITHNVDEELHKSLGFTKKPVDVKLISSFIKEEDDTWKEKLALFKTNSDHNFTGFYIDNENKKHLINSRIVDYTNPETGEVSDPFLSIYVLDETTNKYNPSGTANVINHRKDGKEVNFDKLVINIDINGKKESFSAKITDNVNDKLHSALGFQNPKTKSSENISKTKQSAQQKEDVVKTSTQDTTEKKLIHSKKKKLAP